MNTLLVILLASLFLLNIIMFNISAKSIREYRDIKAKWDKMPKAARKNISKN